MSAATDDDWAWLEPEAYRIYNCSPPRVFRVAHDVVTSNGHVRHYAERELAISRHPNTGRPVVNLGLGRKHERRYVFVDAALAELFG